MLKWSFINVIIYYAGDEKGDPAAVNLNAQQV